jgi:GT2 family glycosyltransferase
VPPASVVVVNHNGLGVIDRCLTSILSSNYPLLEVVVVDNASADGSLDLIVRKFGADSRLKVVANRQNLGFAEGCNRGAGTAKGQYLIFFNYDTEVERDAIENLVAALEENASIGAAQSKLLMMSDKKMLDGAGDFTSIAGWPYSRGIFEIDQGQYDSRTEIFSARGAAMIVRKVIFEEIGGFDSDYFMYYEDVDLSWRVRLRGHTIVFVPDSVVYHLGGGQPKGPKGVVSNQYSGRNYIATLVKNLELRNLLVYGSAHIVVHLSTIVLYLLQGRVHDALGLILALPKAIVDLPFMWRKRQVVQRFRVVSDKEIFRDVLKISTTDYLRYVARRRSARP